MFSVAGQNFGLPIEAVAEFMPIIHTRPVPQLPPAWVGVANIRGAATPVLDLRAHLGLETIEPDLSAPLIILRQDGQQIAILVDQIERILHNAGSHTVELDAGHMVVVLEPRQFFEQIEEVV